jgi:hypothetical protein
MLYIQHDACTVLWRTKRERGKEATWCKIQMRPFFSTYNTLFKQKNK